VTPGSGGGLLWRVGHLDAVSERDAGNDFRQLVFAFSRRQVFAAVIARLARFIPDSSIAPPLAFASWRRMKATSLVEMAGRSGTRHDAVPT